MSEYDALVRYYDADHAGFDDDVAFYRELARGTRERVLEAMCGSGRLLVPLARAGNRVVGVDASVAMLELARQHLDANKLRERVALHHADVREQVPDGPFGLAIVALNSFMHLTTTADQLAVLGRLHTVLEPGGVLALDLFNPAVRGLHELEGVMVLDRTYNLPDGARVQKFVVQRADAAQQHNHVTFIYDELDVTGAIRRTTHAFVMRWLHRFEVEHLLARVGFVLDVVYGSYDLDPFEAGSEIMLCVARKV